MHQFDDVKIISFNMTYVDVIDHSTQPRKCGYFCFITVGGFEVTQLTEGKVALFNMWDYEFTADQVHQFYCETQGNILSMANMTILGPANFTEEDVPCTPGM